MAEDQTNSQPLEGTPEPAVGNESMTEAITTADLDSANTAPQIPSVVSINDIPIETTTPVPNAVGVGRPTVMTPEVLAKLEEAFSYGATDREATFVAGISNDALYDYCRVNPDFASRKEALKDMPKYQARVNIAKAIDGKNVPVSQWYVERKGKDEFSPRTETKVDANITGPGAIKLNE